MAERPTEPIFSQAELDLLRQSEVPTHICLIPDGNRRWAKEAELDLLQGHQQGANQLRAIVQAAMEMGVRTLTLYSFSTENWHRSPEEVHYLMELLKINLLHYREELQQQGVRLDVIGDPSRLPPDLLALIEEVKQTRVEGSKLTLVLAINYGSRDEMRRATQKIAREVVAGRLTVEEISEELISSSLDTAPYGDPELFIRTSGEMRISNFLLWQISYAEIFVSDTLWPDFTPHHLYQIVLAYQQRQRRWGQ